MDEQDIILIGLGSTTEKTDSEGEIMVDHHGNSIMEKVLIINPKAKSKSSSTKYHKDYKLIKGDQVYLIAYSKPNLAEGLK